MWIKIKENWSIIILRLKNRILEKDTIEIGKSAGLNSVQRKLYPMNRNFDNRSESVAKHRPEHDQNITRTYLY